MLTFLTKDELLFYVSCKVHIKIYFFSCFQFCVVPEGGRSKAQDSRILEKARGNIPFRRLPMAVVLIPAYAGVSTHSGLVLTRCTPFLKLVEAAPFDHKSPLCCNNFQP